MNDNGVAHCHVCEGTVLISWCKTVDEHGDATRLSGLRSVRLMSRHRVDAAPVFEAFMCSRCWDAACSTAADNYVPPHPNVVPEGGIHAQIYVVAMEMLKLARAERTTA